VLAFGIGVAVIQGKVGLVSLAVRFSRKVG